MNLKLDVVRLFNEDVIATSAVDVWGIARFYEDSGTYHMVDAYKNGTNNDNVDASRHILDNSSNTIPEGYVDNGVYHIDSSGKIIDKCNHHDYPASPSVTFNSYHNINLGA